MASNELLSEIKKAEEDAKKAVTEALEKKNHLISESYKKARQIIEDGENEAIKAENEAMKLGELELEKEKNEIINKGLTQIDSLSIKSKSNISKAVNYLVEEFEREIRL